jgi:hypothetical protein
MQLCVIGAGLGFVLLGACNTPSSGAPSSADSTRASESAAPRAPAAPADEFAKLPSVNPSASHAGADSALKALAPAAPAVEAASTAAAATGPVVQGEGFAAHLQASGSYQVGKPAEVQVVLQAQAPFHCNDKYPYKFTPAPNAAATYSEAIVRKINITPARSTMAITFTPSQAGKLAVSGELSFSVCTDDKCLVEKQTLSIEVDVKGAS